MDHKKVNFVSSMKRTLNIRPNCSTHSITNCWWPKTLRLFMMRTIEASIAYRLSLSTSSITFFFSSTGGSGIYMPHDMIYHYKGWIKNRNKSRWIWQEKSTHLDPPHLVCELGVELKVICRGDSFRTWLLVQDSILGTWQGVKQSNNIVITQV